MRTNVIELESAKLDLEKKVKIMTDVIKMHEQRQAAQAYADVRKEPVNLAQSQQQHHQQPGSHCHPGYHHHLVPLCLYTNGDSLLLPLERCGKFFMLF